MRRFAASVAILVFFALAGVALASRVPVFDAALRALAGAAITYVVVRVAARLVVSIFVDAILNSRFPGGDKETRQ